MDKKEIFGLIRVYLRPSVVNFLILLLNQSDRHAHVGSRGDVGLFGDE